MIFLSGPNDTPPQNPRGAGLDTKLGDPVGRGNVDPRLVLLAAELFRHAKAMAFDDASPVPAAAGIDVQGPGIFVGQPELIAPQLFEALRSHRVWERFA